MRITSNSKQPYTENITITLEQKDYQPRIEESLKKYSKTAKIPGFRPGKVLVSHLKHLYGNSIFFEEINNIFNDALNKYIKDSNLDIVGGPILLNQDALKNISIDKSNEVECEFEIGLSPDMSLDITTQKFTQYLISPNEKDIDKEIELLQKALADRKDLDKSDAQSMLAIEIEEKSIDSDEVSSKVNRLVDMSSINSETIKNVFLDLHKGHTFNINLSNFSVEEQDEIITKVLKLKNDNSRQSELHNINVTVNRVWHEEMPELSEGFFKKAFPNDTPKTIEDFREKIAQGLKVRNKEYSEINLAGQVIKHIEKELKNKDLPEEFLKKWLKQSDAKITDTKISEGFEHFMSNLRWNLFEKTIQKENNIEISKEDIAQAAMLHITEVARSHGYSLSEEQLKAHTKELLQDKNSIQSLYQNTLSAKVYKYLRDKVSLENKEVDFEQFDELSKSLAISDLAYNVAKEAFIRGLLTN